MNRLNRIPNRQGNNSGQPKVLAVASGKGGVGKSVISLNLADHLAKKSRVLLIDGDFLTGNLHLLANTVPGRTWQNICFGQAEPVEAIIELNQNLHLLPSGEEIAERTIPDIQNLAKFLGSLRDRFIQYEYIIFDTSSGILPQTTLILHSVDEIILVVIPELTAISDGYALYKTLINNDNRLSISLLVNRQDISEETEYIHDKFTALTNQFLGQSPTLLGSLRFDRDLVEAIASQKVVSEYAPKSGIDDQFSNLAKCFSCSGETVNFAAETINTTALRADTKE
jgi:flagellar biosynthesis protein FlhG